MLTLIPWLVLLHGLGQYPILGAKLLKYDMAENCGRTVSMSDDGIYGIDIVMNMTSRMGTLGKCRLKLKTRDDFLDYLHFYIADSSLPDCGAMSMYINEGYSLYDTVPHKVIPEVCGWKANALAGKDFRTIRRYLMLEFSWKLATPFTGTVFRLVANSYACAVSCAPGFHRCNQGHCINSYLNRQPGYDFCGSSPVCTADKVPTIRQIYNKETHDPDTSSGGYSAFTILLGLVVAATLYIIWKCRRRTIYNNNTDNCAACLKSCFCHCFYVCCSCWCRCCEGCWERVAKRLSNIRQSPTRDEAEYPDEQGYFERYAMMPDNRVITDPISPPPSYTAIMETSDDHPVPFTDVIIVPPTAPPSSVPPTSPRSLVSPTAPSRFSAVTEHPPDAPMDNHTDPPSYDIARDYPPADMSAEHHTDPPSYDISTANLPTNNQPADPPSYDAVMVNIPTDSPNNPLTNSSSYDVRTVNLPAVTPNEPHVDPPSYIVASSTRGTVDQQGGTPIVPTTDPPPRYDVATTVHPQTDTPSGPTARRPLSTTDEPPDYDVAMESRTSYDTSLIQP